MAEIPNAGLSSIACHGPVLFHLLQVYLTARTAALDVLVLGVLHKRNHADASVMLVLLLMSMEDWRSASFLADVQEAGLLISRRAHGAHHKAPFEGNYCIVSGLWNEALDQQGSDQGFFRKLERFVAARTGVEPRCWYEPKYEIEEMQE